MKSRIRNRNEKGVTIALVVLALVAMLGIAAIAVDMGVLYTARTSAQHAADAAALAGASTFVFGNNPGMTDAERVERAKAAAYAAAQKGAILGDAITNTEVTPAPVVDVNLRRVKVTITKDNVPTFFGRVLGFIDADIKTVATAEASTTGVAGSARCVKPIFVPNTVLSTQATTQDACAAGEKLFDSNGKLTTWAKAKFTAMTCDNFATIRPMDPKNALAPGQYFSIDFGSGGRTYACTLRSCLNDPECGVNPDILENYALACNKEVQLWTENGGMIGPTTKKGIDELLDLGPDTFTLPGTITNAQGNVVDNSPQNNAVPVWDNCEPGNDIDSGKQSFKVVGLAEMFITGYDTGPAPGCGSGGGGGPSNGGKGGDNGGGGGPKKDGVQAWVRNAYECGAPAGEDDTTPVQSGPFAVPIRLIQNQ